MKKNILLVLLTAFLASFSFAQETFAEAANMADAKVNQALDEFPKGTWIDSRWDGAWEFGVKNSIILKDAKTGEVIYNFVPSKRENFKIDMTDKGLAISFYCADTKRAYKFTKPITLTTDLILDIDADFLTEHYNTNIKMK